MQQKYSEQHLCQKLIKQQYKNNIYYYCIAQKQSNSGLIYNKRLLIIEQPQYIIYYTKCIPDKPYSQIKYVPKYKQSMSLVNIKIKYQQNQNKVELWEIKQKGNEKVKEKYDKIWKFQFYSKQLARKWSEWALHLQQKSYNLTNKSTYESSSLAPSQSQSVPESFKIFQGKAIDFSKGLEEVEGYEYKKILGSVKMQRINQ